MFASVASFDSLWLAGVLARPAGVLPRLEPALSFPERGELRLRLRTAATGSRQSQLAGASRLYLGLGQNKTARGPQVLVHVSICQGAILGYLIFDSQPVDALQHGPSRNFKASQPFGVQINDVLLVKHLL